jgi:hypothetical protein
MNVMLMITYYILFWNKHLLYKFLFQIVLMGNHNKYYLYEYLLII